MEGPVHDCRTRSWEKAEALAVEERSLYDPAEILKRKLEGPGEGCRRAEAGSEITVEAASILARRSKGSVGVHGQDISQHKTKISSWAATQGVTLLREVTAAQLDTWRSDWSLKARALKIGWDSAPRANSRCT